MIKSYCKNCGKLLENKKHPRRKMYCNDSCKAYFFEKRRLAKIQKMGPEEFIQQQLGGKVVMLKIDDNIQIKVTIETIRRN